MDASRRRVRILDYLRAAKAPVSATALAKKLSVSRQIIVGDVALLRAAGEAVTATPRGLCAGPAQAGAHPHCGLPPQRGGYGAGADDDGGPGLYGG